MIISFWNANSLEIMKHILTTLNCVNVALQKNVSPMIGSRSIGCIYITELYQLLTEQKKKKLFFNDNLILEQVIRSVNHI